MKALRRIIDAVVSRAENLLAHGGEHDDFVASCNRTRRELDAALSETPLEEIERLRIMEYALRAAYWHVCLSTKNGASSHPPMPYPEGAEPGYGGGNEDPEAVRALCEKALGIDDEWSSCLKAGGSR